MLQACLLITGITLDPLRMCGTYENGQAVTPPLVTQRDCHYAHHTCYDFTSCKCSNSWCLHNTPPSTRDGDDLGCQPLGPWPNRTDRERVGDVGIDWMTNWPANVDYSFTSSNANARIGLSFLHNSSHDTYKPVSASAGVGDHQFHLVCDAFSTSRCSAVDTNHYGAATDRWVPSGTIPITKQCADCALLAEALPYQTAQGTMTTTAEQNSYAYHMMVQGDEHIFHHSSSSIPQMSQLGAVQEGGAYKLWSKSGKFLSWDVHKAGGAGLKTVSASGDYDTGDIFTIASVTIRSASTDAMPTFLGYCYSCVLYGQSMTLMQGDVHCDDTYGLLLSRPVGAAFSCVNNEWGSFWRPAENDPSALLSQTQLDSTGWRPYCRHPVPNAMGSPLAPPPSTPPLSVSGDFTGDGIVDAADGALVGHVWSGAQDWASARPSWTTPEGDMDGDGTFRLLDALHLIFWSTHHD